MQDFKLEKLRIGQNEINSKMSLVDFWIDFIVSSSLCISNQNMQNYPKSIKILNEKNFLMICWNWYFDVLLIFLTNWDKFINIWTAASWKCYSKPCQIWKNLQTTSIYLPIKLYKNYYKIEKNSISLNKCEQKSCKNNIVDHVCNPIWSF